MFLSVMLLCLARRCILTAGLPFLTVCLSTVYSAEFLATVLLLLPILVFLVGVSLRLLPPPPLLLPFGTVAVAAYPGVSLQTSQWPPCIVPVFPVLVIAHSGV